MEGLGLVLVKDTSVLHGFVVLLVFRYLVLHHSTGGVSVKSVQYF